MLHQVQLRNKEYFAVPTLGEGPVHDLTGSLHIVALERKKASVLHRKKADRPAVLFSEGFLQGFEKKVFDALVVLHPHLKGNEGQLGLQVAHSYVLHQNFVELPSLLHLLVFFFKQSILERKLNLRFQIRELLKVGSGSLEESTGGGQVLQV